MTKSILFIRRKSKIFIKFKISKKIINKSAASSIDLGLNVQASLANDFRIFAVLAAERNHGKYSSSQPEQKATPSDSHSSHS